MEDVITLQFIHSSLVKKTWALHILLQDLVTLPLYLFPSPLHSLSLPSSTTHLLIIISLMLSLQVFLSISPSPSLYLSLTFSLSLLLSYYSLSLSLTHTLQIHLTCCQASTARRVVRLDLSQVGSGHRLLSQCYPLCVELEITSEKKRVRDRETERVERDR